MGNFASIFISALLIGLLLRLLVLPIRAAWKILLHSACGFLSLWLLNSIAGFTGVSFPLNLVTVIAAGFLGLPGIAALAILQAVL